MGDISIRIEGLSKQYRIGRKRERYRTLRDTLMDVIRTPFLRAGRLLRGQASGAAELNDTIWALRDVSIEIKRGEAIGIIGSNGAGKSTLLKILSRITEPTSGFAEVRGRVGALLEVGTGFHAELTGRENVYLNGAILGMKQAEIQRKFDEIVAFAEVEKFIDTPVKHYSSGMQMRLAFAVAAHLEPEVLVVDEVLAVGDARFYTKCVEKMRSLNSEGMTIVVVTHIMWLVQTFCSRAICLEKGHVITDGKPLDVIGTYRNLSKALHEKHEPERATLEVQQSAKILSFQVSPHGRWATDKEAFPNSGIKVVIVVRVSVCPQVKFLVRVTSPDGFPYFTVYSDVLDTPEGGRTECEATIPHLMLMPGEYFVWGGVCSHEGESQQLAEEYIPLSIRSNDVVQVGREYSLFWNQASWCFRTSLWWCIIGSTLSAYVT
jgi:ABC-type polysaccharide/polyol phosphate transport system ATPase subunit